MAMEPRHSVYAAVAPAAVVQAMQAAILTVWLGFRGCGVPVAVIREWRDSPIAGLCGASASARWLPAPALAGRRVFTARRRARRSLAGLAVIIGVVRTALARNQRVNARQIGP